MTSLGACTGQNGPDLRGWTLAKDFGGSSTWGYDFTVLNDGTLPVSMANVRIEGVWSTDTGYSPSTDATACELTVPSTETSLPVGETRTYHIDCESGASGHAYLLAKVDVNNIVTELYEDNNLSATPLTP